MGEWTDKAKGRIKETAGVAAGVAAGDRELEAEGKRDTAKGELKGKVEDAKRAIKDALDTDKPRGERP
ncbi:CsbD family protein [Myxococcus sp. RHSTA-1-4]|uniref:CsbD family protein n=1 Tax=Myxococcus sp. RHSTA-1-4 TaxID=2874601 RepID=UPI001CBBB455|nr:CsbD family protein [Myxococcus sp. RHSTA-1-4]MBZ4417896.1 CsbD family protein [Myxococcus sp. RHSTA-1-4]